MQSSFYIFSVPLWWLFNRLIFSLLKKKEIEIKISPLTPSTTILTESISRILPSIFFLKNCPMLHWMEKLDRLNSMSIETAKLDNDSLANLQKKAQWVKLKLFETWELSHSYDLQVCQSVLCGKNESTFSLIRYWLEIQNIKERENMFICKTAHEINRLHPNVTTLN